MAPRRPFQVNSVLTAIAIGYRNPDVSRIADELMPRQPVGLETFKWTEYPLDEAFNIPDASVGRKGRVQKLEFSGTEREASVADFGLESDIPYSDIDQAEKARAAKLSTFDPEGHATEMLTDTIDNIREKRVATIAQDLNNYSVGRRVTLSGTDKFSDYDNSDPVEVFKQGFEGTLIYRPNTATMDSKTWSKLASHPGLVEAVRGNNTRKGIITREEFVKLFYEYGLRNVLIGDAWVNTAKPGQPPVLEKAWGSHISLTYNNRQATVVGGGITWGMTAQLGGKIAMDFDDKNIGLEGGRTIRRGERVKELIIAKDVGYFIQDAI